MKNDHGLRFYGPRFFRGKLGKLLGFSLVFSGLANLCLPYTAEAGSVTFKRIKRSSSTESYYPSSHKEYLYGKRKAYQQRKVLIEFVALGNSWGQVELNNQLVYRPQNHNRRKQIYLSPGAYYLEVTGITQFDVWASGYLDVGRNDTNVIVVYISESGGVQVSGDPYAWIPGGR